jgi:hypothetical protein
MSRASTKTKWRRLNGWQQKYAIAMIDRSHCGIPAMRAFLECLNPAFKPPAATSIRGELLEESYEKYSNKVDEIMKHEGQLAFSSDGSTDSRNRGVTNLSVVTPLTGSYVLETEQVEGTDESAEAGATWLKEKLQKHTGYQLDRVSSIGFDTCATQLKIFKIIANDSEMKHVIY